MVVKSALEIEGWMLPCELDWLSETAARMDSIAEIGCWKGRSTFALLEACKGPVYAVDHWLGSIDERDGAHAEAVTGDVLAVFLANVGHFGNLTVVRQRSIEAAWQVPDVDMVFLDGSHRYDDVFDDLLAWTSKAKRLICGHDSDWPGVLPAVRAVLGEPQRGPGSIWYMTR